MDIAQLTNNAAGCPVRFKLKASGYNIKCLRTNAVLRKDDWIQVDQTVIQIARDRLIGVADLMGRGLVHVVPGGIATTVLQYEDVSDMTKATLAMDGITRGQGDRLDFGLHSLPLPINFKDFEISDRVLQSSRQSGQGLDITQSAVAARLVAELTEEMLFIGALDYQFGDGQIFGYTNFPDRNTVTLSLAWDNASKTGQQILTDTLDLKQALIDANFHGPYTMYIPQAYETALDEDFKVEGDQTVRERLLQVSQIESIKVADTLPANNVILVQMSVDVVRMVEALPITTVEWDGGSGGFNHLFKVMTVNIPQIRADQDGRCGVAHLAA